MAFDEHLMLQGQPQELLQLLRCIDTPEQLEKETLVHITRYAAAVVAATALPAAAAAARAADAAPAAPALAAAAADWSVCLRLLLLLLLLSCRRLHGFAAMGLLSPAEETAILRVYAQLGLRHITFCRHMLLRLQQQQQQQGPSKADALQQQRMQRRILLLHFLQQLLLQHREALAARPEVAEQLLHAHRSLLLQPHEPQQQQEQQQQLQQLATAGDFIAEAQRLAETVSERQQQEILLAHSVSCSNSSSSGGLQREVYRHPNYCMGVGLQGDSEAPRSCSKVLPFVSLSTYEALRYAGPGAAAAAAAPAAKDPAAAASAVAAAAAAGELFERQQQRSGPPEAAELTTGQAVMVLDALLQVCCCCCCCCWCCC